MYKDVNLYGGNVYITCSLTDNINERHNSQKVYS